MLLKCTLESYIFGIAYGLYFLDYKMDDLLYFSGRWEYKSARTAFYHIFTTIVVSALIAVIFAVVIPHFVRHVFYDYLISSIGMTLAGFALTFIIPKI